MADSGKSPEIVSGSVCPSHVVMPIARLFFASRPFAVAGLVVAVIINPLNSVVGRHVSHINQEINKLGPTLANLYASATVSVIMSVLCIFAPLAHCSPNFVFRRVRRAVFGNGSNLQATAAFVSASPQIGNRGNGSSAALTGA